MNKCKILIAIVSAFILFSLSFTNCYAALVCCKHHGGVKRCDHVKGYELCRDGHYSKECPCGNYSIIKSVNNLSLIV